MPAINPKNLSAQLVYRARGNPPSSQPVSAISNCFPGLEFDFRNIWKDLFEEVELHEASAFVPGLQVLVVRGGPAAAGVAVFDRLVVVDGRPVAFPLVLPAGPSEPVTSDVANALAHVVTRGGQAVPCVFEKENGARVAASLTVRRIFDGAALAERLAEPGALTQSLCSPWQADYRECGCFYWAASRPDFVNAQPVAGGGVRGHDWMQKGRSPADPYRADDGGFSPNHVTYDDLYAEWERHLKFILEGRDAE